MNRLANNTAIVTGGAIGIGRARVIRMAEEGAIVAIFVKHQAQGRSLASDRTANGHDVVLWAVDVVEAAKAEAGAAHPIGNMGEPDDIAWAVVWQGSEEAKFVTGAEIAIDGAYTAR